MDHKADDRHGTEFSRGPRMLRNNVPLPRKRRLITLRNFINLVRDPKGTDDVDDEFIDETIPHVALPVSLPPPTLGNLDVIDNMVQQSVMTPAGRESLVSFIHEEVCFGNVSDANHSRNTFISSLKRLTNARTWKIWTDCTIYRLS
jgi:hypothetical protein